MGKAIFVHEVQAFEELIQDGFTFFLSDWRIEVELKIIVLDIVHGNEDAASVLVPAQRFDEVVLILSIIDRQELHAPRRSLKKRLPWDMRKTQALPTLGSS